MFVASMDRLGRVAPQIMAHLYDADVTMHTAERESQPLGDTTTLLDIQIVTIHASSSRARRIKHRPQRADRQVGS